MGLFCFFGVSVRCFLGFIWRKFQILGSLGLLGVALYYIYILVWGCVLGLFRVVFWCIYIVPLGVYLDLRSKRTEKKKNRETEQWRSREKKKRRKAKKTEKQ